MPQKLERKGKEVVEVLAGPLCMSCIHLLILELIRTGHATCLPLTQSWCGSAKRAWRVAYFPEAAFSLHLSFYFFFFLFFFLHPRRAFRVCTEGVVGGGNYWISSRAVCPKAVSVRFFFRHRYEEEVQGILAAGLTFLFLPDLR